MRQPGWLLSWPDNILRQQNHDSLPDQSDQPIKSFTFADVNNPGYRDVSFKQMEEAYITQVEALLDGGCRYAVDSKPFSIL
jgi:hypothetical protein